MDLPPPSYFNPPTTEIVEQITNENELYWFFVNNWMNDKDVPLDVFALATRKNCVELSRSFYHCKKYPDKEIFYCGYNHKRHFIIKKDGKVWFVNPILNKKFSYHYKGLKKIDTYPVK